MPLPEAQDRIESKIFLPNLRGTDSAELNPYFHIGSFTYFDGPSPRVHTEKKQTLFTVTMLKILHTGMFIYQPINYDWITSIANSKLLCLYGQKYLTDRDSCSLIIAEISMDYDAKLDKILLEGHYPPYLFLIIFWKMTPKHPYSIVWFLEKKYLVFHIYDFIGCMSKLIKRYWLETEVVE